MGRNGGNKNILPDFNQLVFLVFLTACIFILLKASRGVDLTNATTVITILAMPTSITLYPGWNLISFPYTDIVATNANCLSSDLTFYSWDNANQNWQVVGLSGITYGRSYWVYSSIQSCSIAIAGSNSFKLSSISPKIGWNSMGTNTTFYLNAALINGTCSGISLIRWDAVGQKWAYPSTLEPTAGYWIRVSNNCQLA